MANITSLMEIEPVDAAHEDLFDIRAGRNCMGMATFEYSLSHALDEQFIDALGVLGHAAFPLGRGSRIVKIDVPQSLLIEGIMGLRRLRITLRIGVDADTVRAVFEQALAEASRRCTA